MFFLSFFFHATATTEIYTLSLHDALPICQESFWRLHVQQASPRQVVEPRVRAAVERHELGAARRITFWILQPRDRKSTRLNSSHMSISYAVFCLKKKKKQIQSHIDSQNTT